MKFEALFIDLDGTLLTDSHTIMPGTQEILKELSNSGVMICIVTARSPAASLPYYEPLGIQDNPIVCFNGALIQRKKNILHEIGIKKSLAVEVIDLLKNFEITTSLYRHNDWYAEKMDVRLKTEMEITQTILTTINFDELYKTNFKANKLLGMGPPENVKAADVHFNNIGFPDLHVNQSKPTYLEIINSKASKKLGIEKVIELHHIDPAKIITIGDNYNDMDMLRFSNTSIAMGNAPDEVKKCASFVTDTNNDDGIRKALEVLMD